MVYGPVVCIVRTLRSGEVTHAYDFEFMARNTVANIPLDEPLVAAAHIEYSKLTPGQVMAMARGEKCGKAVMLPAREYAN